MESATRSSATVPMESLGARHSTPTSRIAARQTPTRAASRRPPTLLLDRSMQRRRDTGFTLLEMMIVIVILGIAMSMVFGGAQNLLPESRLRSAANELATRINDVREEAIVRGWTVTLEYDLDRRMYFAWAVAPPGLIDDKLIEE